MREANTPRPLKDDRDDELGRLLRTAGEPAFSAVQQRRVWARLQGSVAPQRLSGGRWLRWAAIGHGLLASAALAALVPALREAPPVRQALEAARQLGSHLTGGTREGRAVTGGSPAAASPGPGLPAADRGMAPAASAAPATGTAARSVSASPPAAPTAPAATPKDQVAAPAPPRAAAGVDRAPPRRQAGPAPSVAHAASAPVALASPVPASVGPTGAVRQPADVVSGAPLPAPAAAAPTTRARAPEAATAYIGGGPPAIRLVEGPRPTFRLAQPRSAPAAAPVPHRWCEDAIADLAERLDGVDATLKEHALYRRGLCRMQEGHVAAARGDWDTYLRLFPTGRFAAELRQRQLAAPEPPPLPP